MDFTALITELGLDKYSEAERKPIIDDILSTLRMRVSMRLASELTPEQMDHIEKVANEQGDEAVFQEMAKMHPNVGVITQEELDIIKNDMKAMLS